MENEQKIRVNLDLTPFVNERLTEMVERLGLTFQDLITRYILEGLNRDAVAFADPEEKEKKTPVRTKAPQ